MLFTDFTPTYDFHSATNVIQLTMTNLQEKSLYLV
jgi:hypothetical protein